LDKLFHRWLHDERHFGRLGLTRHLALRGDPDAATELERLSLDRRSASRALSSAALARNAAVRGHWPTAAYNIAIQRFNNRDLQGYRTWLRRAVRNGYDDAQVQLRHFETRLPHGAARDIRRGRPRRSYD